MPKDPLDIIAQDAKATTALFDSINANIRSAAAAEISAARSAASIVDTTFKARELKRSNDQQIRSRIIQDDLAQRRDERAQATFELNRQLAPMIQARLNTELKIKESQARQAEAQAAVATVNQFLAISSKQPLNDAFTIASQTGDTRLLGAYEDARNRASRNILSGKMTPEQANEFLESEYKGLSSRYTPKNIDYSSANTALIRRTVGDEAAQRYEQDYNPNLQAERRAQAAIIIQTGSKQAIEKLKNETKSPSERIRIEKAASTIGAIKARKASIQDIHDNFFDKGTGAPRRGLEDPIPSSEGLKPFKLVESEHKEAFIRGLENEMLLMDRAQMAVLESLRSGVDIDENELFGREEELEVGPPPSLSNNKATKEDLGRAAGQLVSGAIPAVSIPPDRPLEAIRSNTPLQRVADAKISSIEAIKSFGTKDAPIISSEDIQEAIKGIDIDEHELDRFSFLGLSGKPTGGFEGRGKVDSSAVFKVNKQVEKLIDKLTDAQLQDLYLNESFQSSLDSAKSLRTVDAIGDPAADFASASLQKPSLLKQRIELVKTAKQARKLLKLAISETFTDIIVDRINRSLR